MSCKWLFEPCAVRFVGLKFLGYAGGLIIDHGFGESCCEALPVCWEAVVHPFFPSCICEAKDETHALAFLRGFCLLCLFTKYSTCFLQHNFKSVSTHPHLELWAVSVANQSLDQGGAVVARRSIRSRLIICALASSPYSS